MLIPNVKQALSTIAVSVLAATLMIGVKSVVAEPSVNPPGGGVSPTFTGLTVTGQVDLKGGTLLNSATNEMTALVPLQIADNLLVNGYVDAQGGLIVDEISNQGGRVVIQDDIEVDGDIHFDGQLDVQLQHVTSSYEEDSPADRSYVLMCPSGTIAASCDMRAWSGPLEAFDFGGVGKQAGHSRRCRGYYEINDNINDSQSPVRVSMGAICLPFNGQRFYDDI